MLFTAAWYLFLERLLARLDEAGVETPIWKSSNAPGGDDWNARYFARYADRVAGLRGEESWQKVQPRCVEFVARRWLTARFLTTF
jgi:hypothetical protein